MPGYTRFRERDVRSKVNAIWQSMANATGSMHGFYRHLEADLPVVNSVRQSLTTTLFERLV